MYPTVSIVVPVFNSEQTIGRLVRQLCAVLLDRTEALELILVDDESGDASWQEILKLVSAGLPVHGVRLAENVGQQRALRHGIGLAQFDVVVTIDDDLQNPPDEVPKLLDAVSRGHQLVYGVPQRLEHGFLRHTLSRTVKLTLSAIHRNRHLANMTSFRAFTAELASEIVNTPGELRVIDASLLKHARSVTAVRVRHEPRHSGDSHYPLGKLVSHAFAMSAAFTEVGKPGLAAHEPRVRETARARTTEAAAAVQGRR